MKKLLAALIAVAFALTTAGPAIAAERESGKKMEKKDEKKKDTKKKDDKKKSGQAPGKAGYDQGKNKKK